MYEEHEADSRKGKIKVMYVKNADSENNSKSKTKNRHNSHKKNEATSSFGRNEKRNAPHKEKSFDNTHVKKSAKSWLANYDLPDNQHVDFDDETENEYPISKEQLKAQRMNESKIYGENACQALFKHRKETIIKAWFVESITPRFRNTMSFLASNKRAYNVVSKEELNKISGTEHHGGVCFLVQKRKGISLNEYINSAGKRDCIIALEGVANPHNIGAIVRSAAHFGVKAIMHHDASILDSGAAVRTAEGGAEFITPLEIDDFYDALLVLQNAGYTLVSTSSHQGKPLSKVSLPEKCVVMIGQENDGLTDSTWEKGNLRISIDGTGHVESLNVSVATAVILSKWWQSNQK